MIGFGMMDNTILIHAGDSIERNFGVKFGLTGLQSAACGQVLSDFCGVCFGGVIETLSRRYVAAPGLTLSQFQLRVTQLVGTAGAACGVVAGCLVGMGNLLLIDLEEAERLKQAVKLETMFNTVMQSAVETMGCEYGTVFITDTQKKELWTRATAGYEGVVRRPLEESASVAAWCAINAQHIIIDNAHTDPRYCPDIEAIIRRPVNSIATYPVFAQSDKESVIAVVQFFNKPTGFGEDDHRVLTMLCLHFSFFMAACE